MSVSTYMVENWKSGGMFRDDCRDLEPQKLGEWSHSLRKEPCGKGQHKEMD